MFGNEQRAFAQLSPRDQAVFKKIKSYSQLTLKTEQLEFFLELLQVDPHQVIVKYLAREVDAQTAFNLTLWMIDQEIVTLDWLYDMIYQISTHPVEVNLDIRDLYPSGKRMELMDFSMILGQTELFLKSIRFEELNLKKFIQGLEPSVAVSLQTWLLSYGKITAVELTYLGDILSRMKHKQTEMPPPEPDPLIAAEAAVQSALEPTNPFQEKTLEDVFIELNLQQGGTETEIVPRVLDRIIFRKIRDVETGKDRVIYRPTFQVIRYVSDGTNHQELPMPVKSAKAWPPGIYLIQNDKDYIQLMRLPGSDFYEVFPEGPDPFLRAMTIERMVREGQGK
ncbi:hypothetical protein RIF25_13120 [Thermosynechococcaceae cyanobacterium BACA0444]|uniref:Uncharacterized protein n=1 Tax=Pseudocalidococcus azoricus BACA0444 TaxID=2918990 RepID=A0AAE4FUS5_9CYAN|nr:hypothetical protein [Pseudocalidococcus azoricus]MDS3861744.1 hypothetical protein [Pseudocalidococcus azoricus BACA0444]